MTDEKTAPETPLQSEELRSKIISSASVGDNTAVGNAKKEMLRESGDLPEPPHGSDIPIAGGEPQPDHPAAAAKEPVGAQAQPSNFTSNGSLPVNHVASPSGLIPVSAVTSDAKAGVKLVQDNLDAHEKHVLRSGAKKLSRKQVESMSPGDLRAVASDRGYDMGEQSGSRSTRVRFLKAQQEDDAAEPDDSTSGAAEG